MTEQELIRAAAAGDEDAFGKLVEQYQVDELVMGFPRNMDGTEGPRAELYREQAEDLRLARENKKP